MRFPALALATLSLALLAAPAAEAKDKHHHHKHHGKELCEYTRYDHRGPVRYYAKCPPPGHVREVRPVYPAPVYAAPAIAIQPVLPGVVVQPVYPVHPDSAYPDGQYHYRGH